jgi:hypothetical protein
MTTSRVITRRRRRRRFEARAGRRRLRRARTKPVYRNNIVVCETRARVEKNKRSFFDILISSNLYSAVDTRARDRVYLYLTESDGKTFL